MDGLTSELLAEFVEDNFRWTEVVSTYINPDDLVRTSPHDYSEFVEGDNGLEVRDVTDEGELKVGVGDEERFREVYNEWVDDTKKL